MFDPLVVAMNGYAILIAAVLCLALTVVVLIGGLLFLGEGAILFIIACAAALMAVGGTPLQQSYHDAAVLRRIAARADMRVRGAGSSRDYRTWVVSAPRSVLRTNVLGKAVGDTLPAETVSFSQDRTPAIEKALAREGIRVAFSATSAARCSDSSGCSKLSEPLPLSEQAH